MKFTAVCFDLGGERNDVHTGSIAAPQKNVHRVQDYGIIPPLP
jgi:hypothetical protein